MMPDMKLSWIAAPAILFSFAPVANAHIEMLTPQPRYPRGMDQDNKACPCGVGESNRLCNVEGDRSDVDRDPARVTTLVAGQMLTIRWDEYIGHAGRYRVAFDMDGADLEDFNANSVLDIADPAGSVGNTGGGSIWEVEVQVPDVECDNCTMQLIQMMDGNQDDPVGDPIGRSSYYTCADIRIVSADTPDAGPGPADPDAGVSPADPDAGESGGGDDGGGAVGGGCSTSGSGASGLWLLALGALFWRRRKS